MNPNRSSRNPVSAGVPAHMPALIALLAICHAGCPVDDAESVDDVGSQADAGDGGGTDTADPDASTDDTTEPDGSDPDASEPDATEPDATDPDTTEPDATEPDATDAEICDDALDNDGDGATDCDDDDCAGAPACEEPASPWTLSSHPCVGSRTDALHCVSGSCYVGCGTTTDGRGAYVTSDFGATWTEPVTDPEDVLAGARINDISSAPDGKIYFAGEIVGSTRVVSLDGDGALAEVWNAGSTVDFSFTAGSFRRNGLGWSIAESLTGNGIVYRTADGDPTDSWATGYGFWRDDDADDVTAGVQILAMETYNDGFYAVGSTIAQPPTVFLPNWTDGSFDFHIVQLNASGLSAFVGELWDIDVNADGVVVGGVNQDDGVGIIYTRAHEADPADMTDPASWNRFDVDDIFPDQATWVTGVCRAPGVIYAVGRESREEWGFVLQSVDGGETFVDISHYTAESPNPSMPDVSRCVAGPNGVIVAGAGGFFARYSAR